MFICYSRSCVGTAGGLGHVAMARTALTMLNISNNSEQNASIKERPEMGEASGNCDCRGSERTGRDDP